MNKLLLLVTVVISSQFSFGQRIKDEMVEFTYIQLPMAPVDKSITNYQSTIVESYAEENAKLMAEYEAEKLKAQAEYDAAIAAYPAAVLAADEAYAAELKAYNEKSMAEKVIENKLLNESSKPVKRVPPTPYPRQVSMPKMKTSYDTGALAGTYLAVDGFQNVPENAIKVVVTLNGFEYTKPVTKTEVKQVIKNGVSTNVNHYYNEFTYRHTMSVKVTDPSGKELLYVAPAEFNTYTTHKTASQTTAIAINEEQLVAEFGQKILQTNLTIIGAKVNDHVGFRRVTRSASMFYVKEKDAEYTDLLVAFNDASSGLKMMADNEEAGRASIGTALKAYEQAMSEGEMNNKKARIDGSIMMPMYFSMIELYWVTGDLAKVDKLMGELNAMPLDKKDKATKDTYQLLVMDTKARLKANGL